MRRTAWYSHVCALVAYATVALAFSWPLPLHLSTHLTGDPDGDTGVYVWNQWVFQHELLDHRSQPYFTDTIFASGRHANLGLHNYTTFQNLLALPLQRLLGVVTTFNVILLLMSVITAYATFLLAKRVTGRPPEAWLGGLLFAWSPVLVTRSLGHFSLVAAAPLAIFLLLLVRKDESPWEQSFGLRRAFAFGATVWWAASTDVYYAVYCVLIAAVFVLTQVTVIERGSQRSLAPAVRWTLDVLLLTLAGLVVAMLISRGWSFQVFGRPVHMRSLYTPMLVFTTLALVRVSWQYRISFGSVTRHDVWQFARLTLIAGLVSTALMSPVLYAVTTRILDGRFDLPKIFWRSSPPGTDVLALLLPNPNHPFAPAAAIRWLSMRPNAYIENVASVPLSGLLVLIVAWQRGWKAPRLWASLTIVFGLLALGPFVTIGGINTYVPGPWAVLRYVPIIGLTRSPTRLTVVMMLAFAVLFVAALTWLGRTYPERRRWMLLVAGLLLALELLPVPRPLYSAAIPTIYRHVAEASGDVRLLELPFGIRDGTFSVGNATARAQYFQTFHGKPIQGGYLSRVSERRVREARRNVVLDALIVLSEGKALDRAREVALMAEGQAYVARARLGFVVIDRSRVSNTFRDLAVRAFRLQHVESDGPFELYSPILEPTPNSIVDIVRLRPKLAE